MLYACTRASFTDVTTATAAAAAAAAAFATGRGGRISARGAFCAAPLGMWSPPPSAIFVGTRVRAAAVGPVALRLMAMSVLATRLVIRLVRPRTCAAAARALVLVAVLEVVLALAVLVAPRALVAALTVAMATSA